MYLKSGPPVNRFLTSLVALLNGNLKCGFYTEFRSSGLHVQFETTCSPPTQLDAWSLEVALSFSLFLPLHFFLLAPTQTDSTTSIPGTATRRGLNGMTVRVYIFFVPREELSHHSAQNLYLQAQAGTRTLSRIMLTKMEFDCTPN